MKYMLLIYGAEDAWTDEERTSCMLESMGISEGLAAQGKYVASSPLHPVGTARTVRVRNGETLVTEGPFAETTEQLGGYYILDLEHLDEAIAVAAKLPPAKKGFVEIRPLDHLDGLPPSRPLPCDGGDGSGNPYMLLCYDDESAWEAAGAEALAAARQEAAGLAREIDAAGRFLSASPLRHSSTATCVSVRDGKRRITDGPFTETREVLGGFYMILADDAESALRLAERHPGARVGAVEVRPVFDLSGLKAGRENSSAAVDPAVARSTT